MEHNREMGSQSQHGQYGQSGQSQYGQSGSQGMEHNREMGSQSQHGQYGQSGQSQYGQSGQSQYGQSGSQGMGSQSQHSGSLNPEKEHEGKCDPCQRDFDKNIDQMVKEGQSTSHKDRDKKEHEVNGAFRNSGEKNNK